MGTLTLPASGFVYADAQIAIYSADAHPLYALSAFRSGRWAVLPFLPAN